jgi:hypothetical protein
LLDSPLVVLSALAEGADRLVAQRVLTRANARLIVPLPLARDEYMQDFESDESKREFLDLLARADEVLDLPPQPTRNEAYRAAGLYVLDHCDVLIAWVHTGNRKPGTNEPTSLGDEQGTVTFENLPGSRVHR